MYSQYLKWKLFKFSIWKCCLNQREIDATEPKIESNFWYLSCILMSSDKINKCKAFILHVLKIPQMKALEILNLKIIPRPKRNGFNWAISIAHDFLSALEFLPSDTWTFNNVERRIRRENAAPRGNYFFSKANCSKWPRVAAYIP